MKAGLIGEGIAGSLTPAMHEAEGRAQGLDYSYARIDTATERWRGRPLADLLRMAEEAGFSGVNITHPYKEQVVEMMHDLSGAARDLQAVNTVIFQGGRRIGHNTDYIGYRSALRRDGTDFDLENVLLLGAGGAGSAVALALVDQGVRKLDILDTNTAKSDALARKIRALRPTTAVRHVTAPELRDLDGVVNATPLGMQGHPGMALDPALLSSRCWVADIVYFPLHTRLLRRAGAHGCAVMTGAGMAVFQAVASFALFTGRDPDPTRMQRHFDAISAQQPAIGAVT